MGRPRVVKGTRRSYPTETVAGALDVPVKTDFHKGPPPTPAELGGGDGGDEGQ